MENQSTASEPITPSLARWPEPQQAPELTPESKAEPEPIAQPAEPPKHAPHAKRRQQKRKPKYTDRKPKPTGPLTEVEALKQRVAELQYRKDLKLLDAQLRVITVRKFLQSHDLWQPFLAANRWW
jgi:hypothetical protein